MIRQTSPEKGRGGLSQFPLLSLLALTPTVRLRRNIATWRPDKANILNPAHAVLHKVLDDFGFSNYSFFAWVAHIALPNSLAKNPRFFADPLFIKER